MIESLLPWDIWWMNALLMLGIAFLALLFPGIPVWMVASKLRWRRRDVEAMELHEESVEAFRRASEVAK